MRAIYWILGGLVVLLTVIGLIAFSNERETREAEEKAQELTQKFDQAGLRVPQDQDILVRTLGDDGGAVCETADDIEDGLGKGVVFDQLVNGAAHVGRRPIIADRRVLTGALLILETYCPDELEDVREAFEELEYDDVIEG
jgi:hypothetical protein